MHRGCEHIDQHIDIERALAALTAKQAEAAALLGIHRIVFKRRLIRAQKGYINTLSRGYK